MTPRLIAIALAAGALIGSPLTADETTARELLARGPETAYLQGGDTRLERIEPQQKLPDGAIVFQKFMGDLPIHGARVIVIEEADGSFQVFDDSSENLALRPGLASMTSEAAIAVVEPALELAIRSEAELVWFRTRDEAVLAWEVTTSLADAGEPVSPTHMETVIDAETGALLSQRQIDTKVYTDENADGVFPRIVINDAIGAAGARTYGERYDAVVEVAFGCSGVLIAQDVVLCARHCGVGAGDTIIFGANSNGGGIFSATVQSSILPDGGGTLLDGGDVVILPLTSSIPASIAEPMRLIDETDALEGMVCATVGYGYNGVGSVGHGFSADGRRWGGENIIDVYGSPSGASGTNIISTDFDDGSNGANTIPGSSPVPVEYEATTAPGDSGGPVLVRVGTEWVVAGVLSGGTTSTSVYGDISWWTGTALFRSAIEGQGGQFIGSTEILLPDGLPGFVSSSGGDILNIAIASDTDAVVPGSGTFHVNTGSGFQQFALTETSSTTFTATFPASECLTTVDFYISFQLDAGGQITLPSDAPGTSFSVLSLEDVIDRFDDSFDSNLGWTVVGDATDGQWERAVPNNGDRGDPAEDAEVDGGGFCFVTDNGNLPDNDNTDVDGGATRLTSPVMDASGSAGETAYLSYYRWYSNDFGAAPNADTFVIEISNDAGASWTNLETIGPAGAGTSGGWIFVEHRIDDVIAPTANMRVRFTASDFGDGSVVEAGVDAVTVRLVSCADDPCIGDVDASGAVDFNDLIELLAAWGPCSGCPQDVNGSGAVDFTDLLELLAAWGPCP